MLNIKKLIPFIIFFSSIIFTNKLIFLFFDITNSPDFTSYFSYIDFFFLNIDSVQREQGLFYFYLISASIKFFNTFFIFSETTFLLNKAIYTMNNLIYLYGLIGYYFLLRNFNFSKKIIFISLTFLNFFPVALTLRMTLKPEIVAFAFIPWLILFFEKYLKTKKIFFLFFNVPFISLLLTSKGSIAVITGVFFVILYLKKLILSNKKYFLYFFIFSIAVTFLINFENNTFGVDNIFNIKSGVGENISLDASKYNNKASPSISYRVNLFKLFTSPIKDEHSDSLLAIILLDTFGDYFNLYWNNNDSLFLKNRKEIINTEITDELKFAYFDKDSILIIPVQKETDLYLRPTISLFMGILFFLLLIINVFKNAKYKYFLSSPIIGILIILIHVISGIPKNNFDPNTGDTLKPYYYSYFLCLALVFLVLNYLDYNFKISISLLPYVFLILFIIGFPKDISLQKDKLLEINQNSFMCSINKNLIEHDSSYAECKVSYNHEKIQNIPNFSNKIFNPIFNLLNLILIIVISTYYIVFLYLKNFFFFKRSGFKNY